MSFVFCNQRSGKGSLVIVVSAVLAAQGVSTPVGAAEPLTVYAYRQMAVMTPLLDQFTRETGVAISVVSGQPDVLLGRLVAEGPNSPADVLLTIDVTNLEAARIAGVLRPLQSLELNARVPAWLRDRNGYWVAQSLWPRAILTAVGEPARTWSYSDLADPAQKGRVCVRSSSDIYSASFMESAVANLGKTGASRWAEAVIANLAAAPFKTGKALVNALEAGSCRIALDNAFYIGRMRRDPNASTAAAARTIGVIWPTGWTSRPSGAVFAVSGAALAKNSPHPNAGRKLIEFLARPDIQLRYTDQTSEFPALSAPTLPPSFASMPLPQFDRTSLRNKSRTREADSIYHASGWN